MRRYEVREKYGVWFVLENESGMGLAVAICFSEATANKICEALNKFS